MTRAGLFWFSLAIAAPVVSAQAEDIDSEHIFGFTEGTEIGEKGEKEAEFGLFGRFGKAGGRYVALTQSSELKLTITDNFRISPGVFISHYDIRNVPGLPNYSGGGLDGFSFEMKYRVLERGKSPFGLTLAASSAYSRFDAMGSGTQTAFDMNFFASLDKELVPGKLYGALNFGWAPGVSQARGATGWDRASELSVSGALSYRLADKFLLGGEVRYVRAFDGVTFNHSAGHALFVGPNFYYRISEKAWFAGAWNFQAAGKTFTQPGRLDLANFERHEARLRFGIGF